MRIAELTGPDGLVVHPDGTARGALLVLSGSSGRIRRDRCEMLAGHGFVAMSVRWFGDGAPTPTIAEVPVELFVDTVGLLRDLSGPTARIGVVGTSFGALAALLVAVADSRVDVVVALAPSHVVWASPTLTESGSPVPLSSFSWRDDPLHCVPLIDQTTWQGPPFTTPRQVYEASLRRYAGSVAAARVVAEDISATTILTAGGDDAVWPSALFADEVRSRRAEHGLATTVLVEPEAGHRVILPGEAPAQPTQDYAYGGTPEGDRRLGDRVLAALLAAFPADEALSPGR